MWRWALLFLPAMNLAVAANFAGPPVPAIDLFAPNGIAIAGDGSIFVHSDSGLANIVTRFTPERLDTGSITLGGVSDLGLTGRMALDPGNGLILHLSEMGLLQAINPNTGLVTLVLDLRNPQVIPIDATQVLDLPVGAVRNLSDQIIQFDGIQPRINFGDIAILRRGNRVDIFMTGVSIITSFVMRLTFTENTPAQAKVLVASLLQVGADIPFGRPLPTSNNPAGNRAGFINVARGVAVNGDGTVLTSLPVRNQDVAIAFNADYNPVAGPPPTVILGGQNLFTRGMTTDSQGNFYLATGSIGTTACGVNGSGALVIIPRTLNGLSCGNLGNVIIADSLDVAVNAAGNRAYMTILNLGLVVEYPIDPAATVQVSAGADGGGGGGGGSMDWFLAVLVFISIYERYRMRKAFRYRSYPPASPSAYQSPRTPPGSRR